MSTKSKKMNQNIKKKWVKALRSGKYEQGQGCLQESGKYCCLGVLCDVYDKNLWMSSIFTKDIKSYLGEEYCVPIEVRDEIRFDSDKQDKLIEYNDNKGWSFKKIAAYIDRYL